MAGAWLPLVWAGVLVWGLGVMVAVGQDVNADTPDSLSEAAGEERVPLPDAAKYCIIGAGPAGLQLGYYMQKANRDYVILDRAPRPGSFFEHHPIHRKLISINKRYTGKTNRDYNLRHDWNSLLTDDEAMPMFTNYTPDFWPSADVYTQYLRDFALTYNLNIAYNTNVDAIVPLSDVTCHEDSCDARRAHYALLTTDNPPLHCEVVVMATGMYQPYVPDGVNATDYTPCGEASIDPEHYAGKNVMILGKGNSALEVGTTASERANYVHFLSRTRIRLAWQTHYVGDIRAVNGLLLDMYQLKSQDGFMEADARRTKLQKCDDGKFRQFRNGVPLYGKGAIRHPYDEVINCMGYRFDADPLIAGGIQPNFTTTARKYLSLDDWYQADTAKHLYVAGTAAHSRDYRKSSGGFIHGFRYLTRTLYHLLMERYEATPLPYTEMHYCDVMDKIVDRINHASSIYQMFHVLGDVIVIDPETWMLQYYEDMPVSQVATRFADKFTLTVTLEYKEDFSCPGCDTVRKGRATGGFENAHKSNFLHPVIRLNRPGFHYAKKLREFHLVEDFWTEFNTMRNHLHPLATHLGRLVPMAIRECTTWKEALEYKPKGRSKTGGVSGIRALEQLIDPSEGSNSKKKAIVDETLLVDEEE